MHPDMSPISTSEQQITLTWDGVEGDKHAGVSMSADSPDFYSRDSEVRNTRQVSLVSEEELAKIAAILDVPELQSAWLGANLLLSGIGDLTQLPSGTRLIFSQGAGLVVEDSNPPCTAPGQVVQDNYTDKSGLTTAFPKAALSKRGLVAWVEKPGKINVGDSVQVWEP